MNYTSDSPLYNGKKVNCKQHGFSNLKIGYQFLIVLNFSITILKILLFIQVWLGHFSSDIFKTFFRFIKFIIVFSCFVCILLQKNDQQYSLIENLTSDKVIWKIKMRILKLWDVLNSQKNKEFMSTGIILVDKKACLKFYFILVL